MSFAENRMVETHPPIPSAIPEEQTTHIRNYALLMSRRIRRYGRLIGF